MRGHFHSGFGFEFGIKLWIRTVLFHALYGTLDLISPHAVYFGHSVTICDYFM